MDRYAAGLQFQDSTPTKMRHANADALSQNPVGQATDDDDFRQEIQDDSNIQNGPDEATERVLVVLHGQDLDWFGLRRQLRGLTTHHRCCFRINHWRCSGIITNYLRLML
jgi:hypothetical protein